MGCFLPPPRSYSGMKCMKQSQAIGKSLFQPCRCLQPAGTPCAYSIVPRKSQLPVAAPLGRACMCLPALPLLTCTDLSLRR